MLIAWRDEYDLGHSAIDADHRLVVDIINRLNDSAGDRGLVGRALDSLDLYVRNHFAREELLMERAGYPDRGNHRMLHRNFTGTIGSLRQEFTKATDVHYIESETLLTLARWWMTHIRTEDPKYKPWIERLSEPRARIAAG